MQIEGETFIAEKTSPFKRRPLYFRASTTRERRRIFMHARVRESATFIPVSLKMREARLTEFYFLLYASFSLSTLLSLTLLFWQRHRLRTATLNFGAMARIRRQREFPAALDGFTLSRA